MLGWRILRRLLTSVLFAVLVAHFGVVGYARSKVVTFVHSSNFYGEVGPYNYYNDHFEPKGLAYYISYVEQLRAYNDALVVVDTGNMLYGNPFADFFVQKDQNPVIELLNLVRPDVFVPGTLELELGPEKLLKALKGVKAKIVASNVKAQQPFVSYYVKDFGDGLKIGVVGVVPRYGKFSFDDERRKVQEAIDALKNKEKVTLIVLATSAGVSVEPAGTRTLALSSPLTLGTELVRNFSKDVDVFLFGNQGLTLALVRGGKVYSLPGAGGTGVNRIEITFSHDGRTWKLASSRVERVSFKDVSLNDSYLYWLQGYEAQVNQWLDQPVLKASGTIPFHKYMAILDDNVITEVITKVLMKGTGARLGLWGIYNQHFNGLEQGDVKRRDVYKMVGQVVGIKVVSLRLSDVENILLKEGQFVDYSVGKISLSSRLITAPWLITLLEGANYAYVANTKKVVWDNPTEFRPDAQILVAMPSARTYGELIPSGGRVVSEIELPVVDFFLNNFRKAYPDGSIPGVPDGNRMTALELKHTVQAGESLRTLVNRLGVSADHIVKHNPQIKDPNIIRPGWVLTYYKRYLELVPPFQDFFEYR